MYSSVRKGWNLYLWIDNGTVHILAYPCWDIIWDHRWLRRSHWWFWPWLALCQCWARASRRWPMTFFLPGRRWFSAGHGWNYNSKNGSADHLSVVFSFFQLTKVARYNFKPTGITQGIISLEILSHYISEMCTCRQNMQNACMQAANFFYQTSCIEKSYIICLHLVNFVLKLTETWKILKKPILVLGSELVFLMFHYLPLGLE